MEYVGYYLMDFATIPGDGMPLRFPEHLWEKEGVDAYSCLYGQGKVLTLVHASLSRHTALSAVPSVTLLTAEAANALKHAFRGTPEHNPAPNMGVTTPPGEDWILLQPEV